MCNRLYLERRPMLLTAVLIAAALVVGCQETSVPVGPEMDAPRADQETLSAKKGGGNGGGGTLVADVVVGDGPAGSITSDCPAPTASPPSYHVQFEESGCLIVTPVGSSYSLTDNVALLMVKEPGKNGRITHVRFRARDVSSAQGGIMHETDELPVAVPVVPDKNGFTLHVHAQNAEVWRMSTSTGGDRVEVIGTISIGDVVYFVQ